MTPPNGMPSGPRVDLAPIARARTDGVAPDVLPPAILFPALRALRAEGYERLHLCGSAPLTYPWLYELLDFAR